MAGMTPAPPRRSPQARRAEPRAPYLFLLPFLVIFTGFFLYPLAISVVMSMQSYAGPRSYRFVGLAHYRFLLGDTLFWVAVANTVSYTVLFLLFQVPASLGLALALNSRRVRGRAAFRLVMLLPFLVGNVLVAVIFTPLLAPRQGVVNRAVAFVAPAAGADLNWKTDPILATAAIVLAALWLSVGWGMVYLLAALQAVDGEQYEAAEIDGATAVRRFWHVTLPGIRPVLAYLVLVGTVTGLQLFELTYVFFQGLGPKLRGLTIVQYLVLRGFDKGDLGMASATGWVLVFLITLVALPQLRGLRGGLSR
jgi:lactose/L-arabinose transport system permease protein